MDRFRRLSGRRFQQSEAWTYHGGMNAYLIPFTLLLISNVFMTFAWYGHLKHTNKALWVVVLASWAIAFFEYCFMVPANRIGYMNGLSAGKLKIMQEAITLTVFVVFSKYYLSEKLTWNMILGIALVFAGVAVVYMDR